MSCLSSVKWKEKGRVSLTRTPINGPMTEIHPLETPTSQGACKGERNSGGPFRETGLCLQIPETVNSYRKTAGVLTRLVISTKRQVVSFLPLSQRCLNSCPLQNPCLVSILTSFSEPLIPHQSIPFLFNMVRVCFCCLQPVNPIHRELVYCGHSNTKYI